MNTPAAQSAFTPDAPAGATRAALTVVPQRLPLHKRAPRSSSGLWWVSPVGILALVVPTSLLLTLRLTDLDFRLFYRSPKTFDLQRGELFLLAALVLTIGIMLPSVVMKGRWKSSWPELTAAQVDVLERAGRVCFWLTLSGYVAFVTAGVARGATPSLVLSVVTQQNNLTGQLKRMFAPVTGITSLTQVGIAYVILASVLMTQRRSSRTTRRLVLVIVLAVARAFLLTERLAMLELLVPALVVGASRARQRPIRGVLSRLLPVAPALFMPMLVVLFGAFEYSRSWVYFRSRTSLSFPSFVLTRFAGYYATSYNNGGLSLTYGLPHGQLPYTSLAGFWTAPGISQLHLYARLDGGVPDDSLTSILSQHATPEFNNQGGLAVPLRDFGTTGGLFFFLLFGLLIGAIYMGFRRGGATGLLLYPMFFTGLAELPRYLYWTEGRTVPALVALLVTSRLLSQAGQQPTAAEKQLTRHLRVSSRRTRVPPRLGRRVRAPSGLPVRPARR